MDYLWIPVLLALVVVAIILRVLITRWRLRRAIEEVVERFRTHGATNPKGAKTLVEMGLGRKMIGFRDYRSEAIRMLLISQVIHQTEDDRYYLSEDASLAMK